jgi:hypothetical protein
MKFSVQPVEVSASSTMEPVVVDLENPTSTDDVTIAIGTNPSAGVLSGTLTVAAVNGVAVFNDLEIDTAGDGYTLVATAVEQRNGCANFYPFGSFQPGYYYNYPPCGTTFSENTVTGNYPHANLNPDPVTVSVTSNPFNVLL